MRLSHRNYVFGTSSNVHICTFFHGGYMMITRKEDNILQIVLEALESGNLLLSFHAMEQMSAREIKFSDISEALYRCERQEYKDVYLENPITKKWNWRFAIRGLNDNGDKDLRIIVVLQNPKTVIVTVIDLKRRD